MKGGDWLVGTEDRGDLACLAELFLIEVPKLAVTVSIISAINQNYLFTAMLQWSFFWTIYYKETEPISNHYQKIQYIYCPRFSLHNNYQVFISISIFSRRMKED